MTQDSPSPDQGRLEQEREQEQLLSSSAVMAAGTIVSRFSGYLRSLLLAAALGNLLHADLFTIGNTIPNMLYILLAGGIFNAVLVPQLVRSMRSDPDRGEAYTNRIVTLSALFLGAVTVVLVAAAPWIMDIFLSPDYDKPELAAQRDSIIAFARYCLPQVFFYGMFALVGQVLNARRRFGPMMWAPIANNLVSIAVLVGYLVYYGPVADDALCSAYTAGPGGLARPGLDPRHRRPAAGAACRSCGRRASTTGRASTSGARDWATPCGWASGPCCSWSSTRSRTPSWCDLASGGTAQSLGTCASGAGAVDATGYTVYAQTFLIVMVPHAVVTVSLATAMLPLLSSQGSTGDLRGLGTSLARVLRTALAVIVPFAVLLPIVAPDLAVILWDWGAASSTYTLFILSLSLFGVGVVFFTIHYLVLRGFYALERTRTVFFIQCAVGGHQHRGGGRPGPGDRRRAHRARARRCAYTASYVVGSAVSYLVLRRTPGQGRRRSRHPDHGPLPRAARWSRPASPAFAAWGLATLLPGHDDPSHLLALLRLVLVGGADVLVFLVLARLMRLTEVNEVIDTVTRRLRRRSSTP